MQVKVVWLSYYPEVPRQGYWDMTLISDLFARKTWHPINAVQFEDCYDIAEVPDGEGAVVVLPARYHAKDADRINADIARLPWVILMVVGDEESTFPVERIRHDNKKIWLMHPIPGQRTADRHLGCGYTPDTRPMLQQYCDNFYSKSLNWFFAGQVTHERRRQCADHLDARYELNDGFIHKSEAFAQGIPHDDYYSYMAAAKVAPCPSGPATPDSFRVFEALEAGCVPIADDLPPKPGYPEGYWNTVFGGDPPFPVVRNWDNLPGYINDVLDGWPANSNRIQQWWMDYKRDLTYAMDADIAELSGQQPEPLDVNDSITVIVPTSPIPAHPDTAIIEETIRSIRFWLPRAEIFILCDGIRNGQKGRYQDTYNEYIRRLEWKCNHEWSNVLPIIFPQHRHQAAMTRETLDRIKTPLLLFVEHDTPIVTDRPIDWDGLAKVILSGDGDMIRLHYEAVINDLHKHLMIDSAPIECRGIRVIRTIQWSQRPHLASVSFYKRILHDHFSPRACTMIEDRMHSVVQCHCRKNREEEDWYQYRLMIYTPGDNYHRSYHTDARGEDSKFEEEFRY